MLGDGDRRGVGGNDHLGREQRVDLLEDVDFELVVFGRGLDDELRSLEVVVVGAAVDARQCCVSVGGADFLLLQQPLEAIRDGAHAARDCGVRDVDHDDRQSRDRAGLCNAVAHGAGANDADGGDVHEVGLQKTTLKKLRRRW